MDLAKASKFMIDPLLSYITIYGKLQNDYLYKTTLSRRLLRFHPLGDVVYAQTMESFLSRFLIKEATELRFLKTN